MERGEIRLLDRGIEYDRTKQCAINELCEEDKPATCSDRTGVYLCPIFCRQDSCRDVLPSYSFASYIPPRMARNTLPAMSHVLFHTFVLLPKGICEAVVQCLRINSNILVSYSIHGVVSPAVPLKVCVNESYNTLMTLCRRQHALLKNKIISATPRSFLPLLNSTHSLNSSKMYNEQPARLRA